MPLFKIEAESLGDMYIVVRSGDDQVTQIILNNILYIPGLAVDLLSEAAFTNKSAQILFLKDYADIFFDDGYVKQTTGGQKVISLMAKVERQLGDWSYLKLRLNLIALKQIYEDYYNYIGNPQIKNMLPLPDKVNFQISLRVETHSDKTLDLDHIRFTPIILDFQVAINHPIIVKPTVIIQANGVVGRTIYNHLHREFATIDYESQIAEFYISRRTGKLVPSFRGGLIDPQPNIIHFEPE